MFAFLEVGFTLKGKTVIPYAVLINTMLLIVLASNFFNSYLKQDGQSKTQIMCMIAFFSPIIQLIYGLLFIRYRVNFYLISNLGQDLLKDNEIDPFGEYGAKIPLTILVF